ncbi:hypothetical protein CMO89_04630 [Candidatus Woesearchaeota archaeon]|nr:hypothetical protein [Candidatus Woesearchaeota archaeon]|tara:strand:+ start:3925 stop:4641 length:717 start_codon:yes stop_codon:yes gene_type:complete
MRIAVTGKIREDVEKLKKQIEKCGHKVVDKNPEVVVSLGGDGSFLFAERKFPGVLKLPVRNRNICEKPDKLKGILKRIEKKDYSVLEHNKVEAKIIKKDSTTVKTAVNEVSVRNRDVFHALRFVVKVNGRKVEEELIGDGIVVSTPFGSTGYFYSVTKTNFKKGLGIAFNNITKDIKPMVLENPVVRLKVVRNMAVVSADNDENVVFIDEGDAVELKESKEVARVVELGDSFLSKRVE